MTIPIQINICRYILCVLISLTTQTIKAQTKDQFIIARNTGTIEAYQEYLRLYPNGEYAEIIKKQIELTLKRQTSEQIALKRINMRANIKDLILGNFGGPAFSLDRIDGGSFYQLSMSLIGNWQPRYFGFSYDALVVAINDPYVTGWSTLGASIFLSPRGGSGFHGVFGYRPAFLGLYRFNQSYFESITDPPGPQWVIQSYEPSDLDVSVGRLHYGLGYQNIFGKLLIGASYEWTTLTYKADPSERLNFSGINRNEVGGMVNFKLGYRWGGN